MAGINMIRDIKALIYMKLMESKNNIKHIFTHPAGIIGTALKAALLILGLARLPYIFAGINSKASMFSSGITVNIAGAAVMLVLALIFFANLKKAVDNYYPAQYSAADVNFLFTSPISSRLIYAWSITEQIFGALLGSSFMLLPLFLILEASGAAVSGTGLFYAFAGLAMFIVVVQTLKFFLYSVSKRFGIAVLVGKSVLASLGAVVIYFAISLYGSNDILQRTIAVAGGEAFGAIPVIGWTRDLIISPLTGGMPVASLILLALFTAIMLLITIYLATDYYEEAIASAERMTKIRAASARNSIEDIQQLLSAKKLKATTVNINWNFKKAYAFLWKAVVANKRRSKGILAETAKYAAFAFLGGIFGYVFGSHGYNGLAAAVILFGMASKKAGSAFHEGLDYELKKSYIFMLPGRARDKLLAVNAVPAVKILVRNSAIVVPMALFANVNIIGLLTLWTALNAINLMNLFAGAAVKVIMPIVGGRSGLPVYAQYIMELLMELPAIGSGILAYSLFHSIAVALSVLSICSLLVITGILYLSEALFNRLEVAD